MPGKTRRRLRGKPFTVPWLRSLQDDITRRFWILVTALTVWYLTDAVVRGDLLEDIRSVLPPAQTRVVSQFSHGALLVEYYPENTTMCNSWILVPAENTWHPALRGVLYLGAMLYVFLGVAIISDIFMEGIEKITAAKEEVRVDRQTGEKHTVTVIVWNETVANLTLMALGSSAPEIMMSCIETIVTLDSEPGELGPSTIVGSAAFNLLCISGVCMGCVDDIKKIKEFGVFAVTTVASLFAYAWMVIVLLWWTKCEVTIVEAALTLLMFPLLVVVAYLQDRNCFRSSKTPVKVEQRVIGAELDHQPLGKHLQIQELWKQIKEEGPEEGDHAEAKLEALSERLSSQQPGVGHHAARFSRAVYRMNAVRAATSKMKRIIPSHGMQKKESGTLGSPPWPAKPLLPVVSSKHNLTELARISSTRSMRESVNTKGVIQWGSGSYSVMENEGKVELKVVREGGCDDTVTVKYHTVDGTARSGKKYEACKGHVVFEQGEWCKVIEIPIIDNKIKEDDETFFVVLQETGGGAELGELVRTEVTIIDDDIPGTFEFCEVSDFGQKSTRVNTSTGQVISVTVPESKKSVSVNVIRRNGCDGKVTVRVYTRDGTAIAGLDYELVDTRVEFDHAEAIKTIRVPIVDHSEYQRKQSFTIELEDPSGGATLGRCHKVEVTIVQDDGVVQLIDKVVTMLEEKNKVLKNALESNSWSGRFREAMVLEAGEEGEELTTMDFVMHSLTIFWKVVFSVVPPSSCLGGWATFVVALLFVGVVTAIVAELASLFGCVVGMKDPVTAITFVALGTSLPDTFASKTAAEEETYADAAIGNVTGSNSVNVFLGLGLPWCIASIYKEAKGEHYYIPAGDLAFSVVVYLCCALAGLVLLLVNRHFHGGELGGPWRKPLGALLFVLWVIYIIIASLKIHGHIDLDIGSASC